MTSKKLLFPAIVLLVAILVTPLCAVLCSIAYKPAVTEYEFPFSVTYELNGETVTIEDVYTAQYIGNGGYANSKTRLYRGNVGKAEGDGENYYILAQNESGTLFLDTNLHADYLMGEKDGAIYHTAEDLVPQISYSPADGGEYDEEEVLRTFGAKLVSYNYPAPIENTYVFSHISNFSGETVLPTVLVGVAALVLVLIFVKKDGDCVPQECTSYSLLCNFAIGLAVLPFFTLAACLSDITDDNEGFLSQAFYFIPAVTALCLAASVALRRKNFPKAGLVVQFVGPVLFALCMLLSRFGLF